MPFRDQKECLERERETGRDRKREREREKGKRERAREHQTEILCSQLTLASTFLCPLGEYSKMYSMKICTENMFFN